MAGIKYILTDVVPNKESAKKDIFNSLLGLLIILSAFLILNTINPQLTNLSALENLDGLTVNLPDVRTIDTDGDGGDVRAGDSVENSCDPNVLTQYQNTCPSEVIVTPSATPGCLNITCEIEDENILEGNGTQFFSAEITEERTDVDFDPTVEYVLNNDEIVTLAYPSAPMSVIDAANTSGEALSLTVGIEYGIAWYEVMTGYVVTDSSGNQSYADCSLFAVLPPGCF